MSAWERKPPPGAARISAGTFRTPQESEPPPRRHRERWADRRGSILSTQGRTPSPTPQPRPLEIKGDKTRGCGNLVGTLKEGADFRDNALFIVDGGLVALAVRGCKADGPRAEASGTG
jgi:hypothetical protein